MVGLETDATLAISPYANANGEEGSVDLGRLSRQFLDRTDAADPTTMPILGILATHYRADEFGAVSQ